MTSIVILDEGSAQQYAASVQEAADLVAKSVSRATAPRTSASVSDLRELVDTVDLDEPLGDLSAALAETEALYLQHAVWFHHKRYLAHLNCPVLVPALAAEALVSAVNTSMDTWDQSTSATLMEQRLISWTARRAGLPSTADGVFTSGGTQSNLQALLMAREEALLTTATYDDDGQLDSVASPTMRALRQADLRIICSAETHFSITTAARLLGLSPAAVVGVATDAEGRLDPEAVAAAIDLERAAGHTVMAVVATAGTTDRGHVDPLPELSTLCRERGVWFHVDAAYGCGLLVSVRHRHLLEGIQYADSITVDYHKSYFQPVSSSAILVRDGGNLRHTTFHADYLNPSSDPRPNQVDKSLQTTRRNDALKLWLTLRTVGADTIGEMVDATIALAAAVHRQLVAHDDFQVVTETQLSTVLFRWQPAGISDAEADEINPRIRTELFDSGKALIAGTVIDGRYCLKFTLMNPNTTVEDVAEVLELIAHTGRTLPANAPAAPVMNEPSDLSTGQFAQVCP